MVEFGDWRKDALGIASQEDDIGRMGSSCRDAYILKEIQGERSPRIWSDGNIAEVDAP